MPEQQGAGMLARLRAMPNESRAKTLIVALVLCLVCSIVVSTAAVTLKPLQRQNAATDRKRNILEVTGLMRPGASIDTLFEQIEARVVDLRSGEFTDAVSPDGYDQRKASRDPASSTELDKSSDIASIKRRAHYAPVYLVREGERVKTIVLPVHGYGLWSTLYGFLALEGDGRTVAGLQFYDHAETPGLGGEVDNPRWRSQFAGKLAYGEQGEPRLQVMKGTVVAGENEKYQVDGLAGATLTSRGVSNMLRFWLGENGFGPFLSKL